MPDATSLPSLRFEQKRLLSWLSQLDEAEPAIPQGDGHPSTRYTFDGIPTEKQILNTGVTHAGAPDYQRGTHLGLESLQEPCLPARPRTKGTNSYISRKEKNGYERIPRSKTKEDRYEYKRRTSRVKGQRCATSQRKKTPKPKRKHTVNEEFHAPNVPPTRLTLHSSRNLGIFNRGKRSSPIKTRVLDHGFSEIDFLNKPSAIEPRMCMPEYNGEIQGFRQSDNEPRSESLRPGIEESHRKCTPSHAMEQGDPTVYPGSELHHPSIMDTIQPPFTQTTDQIIQSKKQGIQTEAIKCPKAGHDVTSLIPNLEGESRIVRLGVFDLPTSDGVERSHSNKYFSLEELKSLMQQRISSRRPEDKDNMTACTPYSLDSPQKRKCESICKGTITSGEVFSKRRRVCEVSRRPDSKLTDGSTNSRTRLLNPSSLLAGSIEVPLNEGFLKNDDITGAIEGQDSQPQRPCFDVGSGLIHDEDTSFISHAFEAAYKAIMRSERDAMDELSDFAPSRNSGTNSDEVNLASILQAPWGLDGRTTSYAPPSGQEIPLVRASLAPDMTRAQQRSQQHLYLGTLYSNQAPYFSIEQDFALGFSGASERAERDGKKNPDIGPLQYFWRRNKLY
ncbi:uncharacterized protein BJX67DRAFT_156390 [Aspergillus lucknowensis]|uniref:Uncharacterized protein n=1 Tax=Aspergillus lucknowensis TaxID=176173 RepID=A0ABR4LMR2_9EURO